MFSFNYISQSRKCFLQFYLLKIKFKKKSNLTRDNGYTIMLPEMVL